MTNPSDQLIPSLRMTHWKSVWSIFVLLCVASLSYAQSEYEWALKELSQKGLAPINNYDSAIALNDSVIAIFRLHDDQCNLALAKGLQAKYKVNRGAFEQALALAMDAHRLHKRNACPPEDLPYLYDCLGTVYALMDDDEKLDSVARLGLSLWSDEFKDSITLAELYFKIGVAQQSIDESMPYYDTAIQQTSQANRSKIEWAVYNNIGYAYAEEGDFERAKYYFKQCLTPAYRDKDYTRLGQVYNNLAGLSELGQSQLNYIDSAMNYANLAGLLADVQLYSLNKGYTLYQMGMYRDAYKSLYRSYVLRDSLFGIHKIKAIEELETKYQSELQASEIQRLKTEQLSTELSNLRLERKQVSLIVGVIALLLLAAFFAYSFLNTRRTKNKLAVKNEELDYQRSISDELLLNILPSEVAAELKAKGKSDARLYDNVTVIFTDFVSFTRIGETMSPTDLVSEINRHFTFFDGLMEKYGLEKIKTIGDAYLAVCGLPDQEEDHALRVIGAAQEIVDFTNRANSKFKVRIGVNSGPVVAGIVGVKKYAYDIWGDTVNTAARMEQNSEEGRINISSATYKLISSQVRCTHRGKIEAKNKGMIDMYFVEEIIV